MQKVEGKLTFCQPVLQSALKLQHYWNWGWGGKTLLLFSNLQTPGSPHLPCKTSSVSWGKGAPFQCKQVAWR